MQSLRDWPGNIALVEWTTSARSHVYRRDHSIKMYDPSRGRMIIVDIFLSTCNPSGIGLETSHWSNERPKKGHTTNAYSGILPPFLHPYPLPLAAGICRALNVPNCPPCWQKTKGSTTINTLELKSTHPKKGHWLLAFVNVWVNRPISENASRMFRSTAVFQLFF